MPISKKRPPTQKSSCAWRLQRRISYRPSATLSALFAAALLFVLTHSVPLSAAPERRPQNCPTPEIATTKAAPADIDLLMKTLGTIRDVRGRRVYRSSPELRKDLERLFDGRSTPTKLAQFYRMLYLIQMHSDLPKGQMHTIDDKAVRDLLVYAGVFPDEAFPKNISRVEFRRSSLTPTYRVSFNDRSARFPLNNGSGFQTWHHGMCQKAKALLFKSPFSFALKRLENDNLKVYKFDNVEIEGVFGTRGIVDIDLNYVALQSVEFIERSPLGFVTARVAKREFEVNDHNWLLRMITSFFSNTTKQAIDW